MNSKTLLEGGFVTFGLGVLLLVLGISTKVLTVMYLSGVVVLIGIVSALYGMYASKPQNTDSIESDKGVQK
ncbi:hypothetical protein GOV13_02700 [Candidatus Pacearchaeota archaeon]|nr:hypothetical protein [Candidatus Pacearchaeota archaeon]